MLTHSRPYIIFFLQNCGCHNVLISVNIVLNKAHTQVSSLYRHEEMLSLTQTKNVLTFHVYIS